MKQLLLLLIILFAFISKSQDRISLNKAIDMALKNNLSLKSEQQKTQYQQALIKSSLSIAPTTVMGEYGQINSIYYDNRFSVSQNFNFPTVYVKQKKILVEEWKLSQLHTTLKEAEIKKTVSETYYSLLLLKQKEQLLLSSDSVYQQFITKAELRLKKGESNLLEKTSTENQRADIQIQLKQLQKEKTITELFLQFLLNTTSTISIENSPIKITTETITLDTLLLKNHPLLTSIQQQKNISLSNTKLEKSKLLPDIFVAYNNMSMKGNGADNEFYNGSKRFQSLQLGVGIPLFIQTQKSKIQANKIQEDMSATHLESKKKQFQNQYIASYYQYLQQLETIKYYETEGLKNANTIQLVANTQFTNGEINYLDWALLTNQSITVKAKYLDAVKVYNETVILLNYLTSN